MDIRKHLLLLVVFLLWLGTSNSTSAYMLKYLGKEYNDACTLDTEHCNPVKFLNCDGGRCLCSAPSEMVYDEEREQCVTLASYSCLRHMPDSNSVQSPKYQVACVTNAKCVWPGDTCACDHRYFEAQNHTCVRQYDYGAKCSSNVHCDQFRFFSCVSGKCSCDPDKNHRYDAKNDKCMVPVGSTCEKIQFISISEKEYKTDECPEHASCTDAGTCKCDPGYRITNDKSCGKELGDECDSQNKKCSDVQFTCRNQMCACKYPLHQVPDGKQCISLVAGPCTTEREARSVPDPHFIQNCTDNAYCQESPQSFSYCKCKEGYIETNQGTCVKAFGMYCENDDECDNVAPLACIENKCACADSLQNYEPQFRRCVGLVGSRCFKESNTTAASIVCTSNAYCVKANAQLNYGKCICARGYSTTQDKTCTKS